MAKPNNDLEEIRRKNRERVRRFRERKRIERELVKRGISMRTIEENAGTDYDRLKTFVVSTLGEGVAATIINDAATGAMRKNTIGSTGDQGGSGSASKSAGVSKRQSKRKGRRSRRRDSEDESTEEEEEEEDDFDELYGALTEEEGDSSPAKAQKSSSKAPVATTAASTASTSTAERATPAKNKSRTARTGLKSLTPLSSPHNKKTKKESPYRDVDDSFFQKVQVTTMSSSDDADDDSEKGGPGNLTILQVRRIDSAMDMSTLEKGKFLNTKQTKSLKRVRNRRSSLPVGLLSSSSLSMLVAGGSTTRIVTTEASSSSSSSSGSDSDSDCTSSEDEATREHRRILFQQFYQQKQKQLADKGQLPTKSRIVMGVDTDEDDDESGSEIDIVTTCPTPKPHPPIVIKLSKSSSNAAASSRQAIMNKTGSSIATNGNNTNGITVTPYTLTAPGQDHIYQNHQHYASLTGRRASAPASVAGSPQNSPASSTSVQPTYPNHLENWSMQTSQLRSKKRAHSDDNDGPSMNKRLRSGHATAYYDETDHFTRPVSLAPSMPNSDDASSFEVTHALLKEVESRISRNGYSEEDDGSDSHDLDSIKSIPVEHDHPHDAVDLGTATINRPFLKSRSMSVSGSSSPSSPSFHQTLSPSNGNAAQQSAKASASTEAGEAETEAKEATAETTEAPNNETTTSANLPIKPDWPLHGRTQSTNSTTSQTSTPNSPQRGMTDSTTKRLMMMSRRFSLETALRNGIKYSDPLLPMTNTEETAFIN